MAKYLGSGYGQANFVARMQQQSLFGYESVGTIEREFSPYAAMAGYTIAPGFEDDAARIRAAGWTCPGSGLTLYVNDSGQTKCAANYGASNQMDADLVPITAPTPDTPSSTIPPPPRAMADSCSQSLVWTGTEWTCPDQPAPPPAAPTLGLTEQVRLALVNRQCSCLSPPNYGMDGSNDTDGDWGDRSRRAFASYAAKRGMTGQSTGAIVARLAAETSGSPVWRSQAEMAAFLKRVKGGASAPAPYTPPPPPRPPNPFTPTPSPPAPAPEPEIGTASILAGSMMALAAVGLLVIAAKRRSP